MRELVVSGLWRLSDPKFNSDADAQVAALCLLANIYGLNAPTKFQNELICPQFR
jgi:hypothetical protein